MTPKPRKRCKHCRTWLSARQIPAKPGTSIRRSITLLTCPNCDTAAQRLTVEDKAIHDAVREP